MRRGLRIIIIVIIGGGLLFALLAAFLKQRGPSKSWRPSFSYKSEKPFGSKLFYERLGDLFDEDSIKILRKGPFDELAYKQLEQHALLIISKEFFPEDFKLEELTRFVEEGNEVLLVSEVISSALMNELDLITSDRISPKAKDSVFLKLAASGNSYSFPARHIARRISYFDETTSVPVSTLGNDQTTCIRVQYGKGAFIIATHPLLFTNYYMVREESSPYIEEILAELPENRKLLWDEYYKPDRPASGDSAPPQSNRSQGLWDYIQQHQALKWAFYILMIGSLAYVLLGGKRVQRLVPIIKPLTNSTLDFTETIGRLYLFERNKKSMEEKHQLMAEKKIRVFLGHIRSKYNLRTNTLDDSFRKSLAAKTGMEEKELKSLLHRIKRVQQQESLLEESLVELNNEIEDFYEQNGR